MRLTKYIVTIIFLLFELRSFGQVDASIIRKKNYTNEFFISGGYNYCKFDFIDVGLRYYHWKNDGQTILAFSGLAVGCEFSVFKTDQLYVPYIGWQGQKFMLAYGVRAEYAISLENQSFGFTPEIGFSLFEFLRITGGYRLSYVKSDIMGLSGFRLSLIAAFPLSLLPAKNSK